MNKSEVEKTKRQANICQADQHFVWAAILWRRVGISYMADYNEWLAVYKAQSNISE